MPLIKNDALVVDRWATLADDQPLPDLEPPIVSLERWRRDREALLRRNRPVGLRLTADQPPSLVADDLERLDVIALEIPKFTDGRAYSTARLLRERYGFLGEIRAVGNVLRDQLVAMARCGFDAFEVADASLLDGWLAAKREISVTYQPGADRRRPAMALRAKAAASGAGVVPTEAPPSSPVFTSVGRERAEACVAV